VAFDGFFDLQSRERLSLALCDRRDAAHRRVVVDGDGVMLNAAQIRQHGLGRLITARNAQPASHHPIQDQRHEAQARVGADPIRQAVKHRRNLDLGFQHPEAALDVGKRLVALDDRSRAQIVHVAHQQQLAVHESRASERPSIDVIAEQIGLQIDPHDAGEIGLADFVKEASLGPAVGELAPPPSAARVLAVELADQFVGPFLERCDALVTQRRLLGCLDRIVSQHQAIPLPLRLLDELFGGLCRSCLCGGEDLLEIGIPSARHREDELDRLPVGHLQRRHLLDVVDGKQAPVGYDHETSDVRETGEHGLKRGHQGGRLGGVAVKDLVVDGQPVGGLHDAEHELAGDHAFFGHAELAHIVGLLGEPLGADRGQIVEDHRELNIDQWAQQRGEALIDLGLVRHQCVHAAKQLLVREPVGLDRGDAHGLQPAQDPELGLGVTESIEDHHAQRLLDGRGVAGAAKDGRQAMKAELAPELVEGPDVAECEGGLEAYLGRGVVARAAPFGAQQGVEECVDLAVGVVGAAKGGEGALARFAGVVAIGLDELDVGAGAGAGELDEHAETLARVEINANTSDMRTCHYKQTQRGIAKALKTIDPDLRKRSKTAVFGA